MIGQGTELRHLGTVQVGIRLASEVIQVQVVGNGSCLIIPYSYVYVIPQVTFYEERKRDPQEASLSTTSSWTSSLTKISHDACLPLTSMIVNPYGSVGIRRQTCLRKHTKWLKIETCTTMARDSNPFERHLFPL